MQKTKGIHKKIKEIVAKYRNSYECSEAWCEYDELLKIATELIESGFILRSLDLNNKWELKMVSSTQALRTATVKVHYDKANNMFVDVTYKETRIIGRETI